VLFRSFPGSIDIQTGSLDDPASLPPQAHIQMAEAAPWMDRVSDLPKYDRYPERPSG
jgi:hypothetical protein